MKKKNVIRNVCTYCLLLWLLIAWRHVHAQADIHFSQFYETSILRNPALTGVFTDNYKVMAITRSQWSSITNPYQTGLLDAEYRLKYNKSSDDYLSFGLLAYYDEAGDVNQKISAYYAAVNYNKSLNSDNNSYLSVGFAAGYLQYSFDPTKAIVNNQFQNGNYNPNNPTFESFKNPKMSVFDLGAGVNYNLSPSSSNEATYMIGCSGYHLTQPIFSYDGDNTSTEHVRWNVNLGMIHELSDNMLLQIHGNFAQQGSEQEVIAGGLIGWRTFAAFFQPEFEIDAGVFYRLGDAIIPVVKMKYKKMALGLSYDVNVSSLNEASGMQGGFEITLSITGNYPKDQGDQIKSVCPRF